MTLLAGLYRMEEHGGLQVPVFSVITWKATEKLKAIHDRMPLILSMRMPWIGFVLTVIRRRLWNGLSVI